MERRKTRLGSNKKRLSELHREIYGQGTVLPGTWLPCGTTVSRRSPVPRPATLVAEPRSGLGREPSASESALARHSRGRRIRPAWVTRPDQALALSHFSIASRSAPHRTGQQR